MTLLRVEVLGERGVADEVGEQHRDDAALLEGDAVDATGLPHDGQNRAPDGTGWAHERTRNHRHALNLRRDGPE